MALNLKSLKAPSYLSLPISEIQYSTSAAASISANTALSSSSPLSPQSPSSLPSADAAITAQFDADPDLQAQLATFLHQYDSNIKNSNEFVETLRNQLLLQQDMAVVWESGRWCCLEDNANRLLYILRKVGWQGQVRVKVLVDRDVDVEVGADANGSNSERNVHPSSKLSSSAAAHVSWGPSVVAVTEESWKAAGMEGIMLDESKGAIGLPVVSPAGDGGRRGKEQQSQQQHDEDGVVSGEGSAADIADAAYSETATVPLKQEVAPSSQHGSPLTLSSEEALDEKGADVQQHYSHASFHRTTTQKSWSVPPLPHSAAVLSSATQRSRMTIRSRRRNHYHHRYHHHNNVLQNSIMSKEANAEVTLHHGSRHSSIRNRRQDRKHDHHYPHYYLRTLPNKTMWDEEQDTDADADDEVDLHEAYEDYSVGSDDDDILVDEEDEVDEEEREEDDEDDKSLEDTRLRHHRHRQWALQQQQPRRQKAYTRHPGIQLPLSISVPPLSGLCSLGILEQPPSVDKSPNTSSTTAEWSLDAVAASKEE
ncbi:hypothetical protein BGW42_007307 [Actinomortierella wolfii]|nr:hypothetical protein BGW42_007307 [Actinomortierella wolfii]